MAVYSFTLILDHREELTDEGLDRLYEAGCDDATFGMASGVVVADFDREAPSAEKALRSAIETVEELVGPVHHVEPGNIVSTGEIAERLGRSRESVRLLASGEQGPGTFPIPVSGAASRLRLWSWPEVLAWCVDELGPEIDPHLIELTEAIADFETRTTTAGRRRTA
ncbi:MAG: hypothetical protein ACRDUY_04135 [Nitriliruptorales bacterium]